MFERFGMLFQTIVISKDPKSYIRRELSIQVLYLSLQSSSLFFAQCKSLNYIWDITILCTLGFRFDVALKRKKREKGKKESVCDASRKRKSKMHKIYNAQSIMFFIWDGIFWLKADDISNKKEINVWTFSLSSQHKGMKITCADRNKNFLLIQFCSSVKSQFSSVDCCTVKFADIYLGKGRKKIQKVKYIKTLYI